MTKKKCRHRVLRKIRYESHWDYICSDNKHSECHYVVKVTEGSEL